MARSARATSASGVSRLGVAAGRRQRAEGLEDGAAAGLRDLGADTVDPDHELVAAEARGDVGAAGVLAQDLREDAQHVVAGAVARVVVQYLEIVEIEIEQRAGPALRVGRLQAALELL